ncbi:TetR/AcrR family transcriptional regulator [Sinomonas sp.]|jgi:AcrR family transcriptional regulator|uniref:TetR/AcrR family transcriptional regulator n=1 Tax=Sinomonas sp. TaxID=1914986 RepID=UPI002FDF57DF
MASSNGSIGRGARERIMEAARELFAAQGIRNTGIEELISKATVAKATFYSHFRSKDELVLAYLARLHEARSAAIEDAVHHQTGDPRGLLGIFDALFEAFKVGVNDSSSFVHVLMEMGAEHPLGAASIDYMAKSKAQIARLAGEAGVPDGESFARQCLVLLKGAVVAAAQRDWEEFDQARQMVASLIENHVRTEHAQAGKGAAANPF